MKTILMVTVVLLISTQVQGCVVYTARFEPGQPNTVCLNVTVCKKE